jgi:hypothetical protein
LSRVGLDPSAPPGNLNLRVGVCYYIETGDDVTETLRLAHDAVNGSDLDRLKPSADHPEYPGWVRWLGWKLQLDGSTFTRNSFTNAPLAKFRLTDPLAVLNELGNQVTFLDHSYGLLTMTDVQEQVFTSRETAALYWLARESDPASSFRNLDITRNWSPPARGVVSWLEISVDASALASDLAKLSRVSLSGAQASQLAAKIKTLIKQVNDGWQNTLAALIRWADQTAGEPDVRPPDYLAGKVYGPFGYVAATGVNPLQLTIEQALAAMTFWGAYTARMEDEVGALAVPTGEGRPGWFADIVVWRANPLAIRGAGGLTLEALGCMSAGTNDQARLDTVNAFIRKSLPSMTLVAGAPVYRH